MNCLKGFRPLTILKKKCFCDDVSVSVGRKDMVDKEKTLRNRESEFRSLFDDIPLGYQSLGADGRLLEVNKTWLKILGYRKEEVIGRWFGDFLPKSERKRFQDRFPLFHVIGNIKNETFEMLRRDGSRLYATFDGCIGRDEKGRFLQTHCIMYDTTEQRRSEEQLRESEERFRTAFEYAAIGMALVGLEGRFLQVNLSLCRMLGYSMQELLETDFQSISHPDDLQLSEKCMRQMLEGEVYSVQFEKRYIHKSGHLVWVQLAASLLADSQGKPLYFITQVEDITQRKEAEQKLALLAAALEQTVESIAIIRTNGKIEYVNPAFERINGYKREEILGKDFRDLKSAHQDDFSYERVWKLLARSEVWTGRTMQRHKNGTLSEVETTISPIRNEMNVVTHYVAIERDVTHERQMERQLRQAQKMEAIGTLAGGIAHDFNNILGAIIGYTEMALLKTPSENNVRRNLEQVLKAGDRAKELVKQILTFSRQKDEGFKPLQVGIIVKEVLKLMRASLPTTIEICQDIPNTSSLIWADPTQIHQVLMNLCTNAAHAMREKRGVLHVSLRDVELDSEAVIRYAGMNPGSYVRLTVQDTGHGMSPAVLARAFDPFFTTKCPGEGTGMGLAVVHGIVQSHRGSIHVDSEEGRGTTFHVFLPKFKNKVSNEMGPGFNVLPRGNERILLVDDEAALADTVRQMLEHLGYNVLASTSSQKALEIFRANPDSFDLLITDHTMSRLTGIELAKEVVRIRPGFPIILCSGLGETIFSENIVKSGIREFLTKPMFMGDLATAVRRALQSGKSPTGDLS